MLIIFSILFFLVGYTALFSYLYLPSNMWYLYWGLISVGATIVTMLLLVLLTVLIMKLTKPTGRFKHRVMHHITHFLLIILGVKLDVYNKERLPKGTYVVYGNHKSMVDAILVYYICNTVMSAAAKSTLKKVPLLPIIMKAFGVMLINRQNDRETAKTMIEAIKNVKSGLGMMIFPEGGIKTLETEEMIDVKPGAYKLATKAGVPIVPVSIIGSSKIRDKKFMRKIKIKVYIHEPILEEEYKDLSTIDLGEKVMEIINEGVKNG